MKRVTSSPARGRPRTIGLVLYPGCMPAGLLSTADLIHAVNRRAGRALFEVHWLGQSRRPISTPAGLRLRPDRLLAESACDVCLLPGFWTEAEADVSALLAREAPLVAALRNAPARQALWSYCAGVALVAAAGRLDGRDATGTWWLQRVFQARFPRVRWRFSEALVRDGGMVTAAGAQGHLILATEQLASGLPPEIMRDVEQWLVLPRPTALHPAFRPVELIELRSPELRRLLLHVQRTPAAALELSAAAKHCAWSTRTLSRRIQEQTGLSAAAWLRLSKLRQVADALTSSGEPLKVIAEQLGYPDESSLHRTFRGATGMTPAQYRQAFGKLTPPTARAGARLEERRGASASSESGM